VDLLIRGAEVFDGTGAPGAVADVAVRGERIVEVGDVTATGGVEVDGHGLALAPGFIDVHSHDDVTVLRHPLLPTKVAQGVTTVVVGNCGFGIAPPGPARRSMLFSPTMAALLDWDDHRGYVQRLRNDPSAVNVAFLVGHGTVREEAMGEECHRPATLDELGRMREHVGEGLAAGAVGLSTGLAYQPGCFAATSEVSVLAGDVHTAGGIYTSHIRNEGGGLVDAVAEAIAIGEESGVPVQLSHHKAAGADNWGRVATTLTMVDEARSRHVDVMLDQYPYTAGSTGLAAVLAQGTLGNDVGDHPSGAFGRMTADQVRLAWVPGRADLSGSTLAKAAADAGEDPVTYARQLVDEHHSISVVLDMMDEADVRRVLAHPCTMIGSDSSHQERGKPHPRTCGTFPRVLGHYSRELGVLDLATAVHRMTGLPAGRFGLEGRGAIAVGAAADLVLFDPGTIVDRATFDEPLETPVGVRGVWVNGTRVIDDGVHTGARPGRVLAR
jgi:N-acyl-D-aspartate/D-glutamate deacylase